MMSELNKYAMSAYSFSSFSMVSIDNWRVLDFSVFFFFFSSRRRHTRSLCDWSSDVCSSDLLLSYLGICVLLWKWLSRLLSGPLLFVAATCIALTQPLVEVASLSSPDALSTAVLLFAIYLLVERDQIGRASCREGV